MEVHINRIAWRSVTEIIIIMIKNSTKINKMCNRKALNAQIFSSVFVLSINPELRLLDHFSVVVLKSNKCCNNNQFDFCFLLLPLHSKIMNG